MNSQKEFIKNKLSKTKMELLNDKCGLVGNIDTITNSIKADGRNIGVFSLERITKLIGVYVAMVKLVKMVSQNLIYYTIDIKNKNMILRSGKMIGNDYPIIDFDEASRKWRENKIKLSEGCFKYNS